MKPTVTKELVEQQMNSTLSYFPCGGKEIAVMPDMTEH